MPQDLYQTERWDGTNGAAPDDVTWEIPVVADGSVTVNLFMAHGWTGADEAGERQFEHGTGPQNPLVNAIEVTG